MPSKKRKRPTSAVKNGNAASSGSPSTTKPVSLGGFNLLPLELKQHIIGLACLAPSSSSPSPPSKRCLFGTDTATALSLSHASRELNELAMPALHRAIVITRPSALYFLQRTLKEHPERARLTRRLHIGPLDALPEGWWPLKTAYLSLWPMRDTNLYTWIKTSLTQAELPSGYKPNRFWALGRVLAGCREAAISEALQAAREFLGINVSEEGRKPRTQQVLGIMEVQAVLDLYLERLREMEEQDDKLKRLAQPGARVPLPCRNGNCKHYEAVYISGAPRRRWSFSTLSGTEWIPRLALVRHLGRPGAVTDRFDHPLVFARSGLSVIVEPEQGSGFTEGGTTRYWLRSETWDIEGVHEKHVWPDLESLQSDMHGWEIEYLQRREDEETEECIGWAYAAMTNSAILVNTGTLGQTFRLVRSLLATMSNLKDLSLTGYLEAVFEEKNHRLSHLRRLSLGPSPFFWNAQLVLSGLTGLEKLHLCGIDINAQEVSSITDEMPRLREFRWTLMEDECSLSVVSAIERLLKRDAASVKAADSASPELKQQSPSEATRSSTSSSSSSSSRSDGNGSKSTRQQQSSPNDALIVARVHPSDVLRVLARAQSSAMAGGWRQGNRAADGQRRLLLQENVEAGVYQPGWKLWEQGTGSDWNKLYEEGTEWWRAENE